MARRQFRVVSWDVDGTLYSLPSATRNLARVAGRQLGSGRPVRAALDLVKLVRAREAMRRAREQGGYLGPKTPAKRLHARAQEAFERWYGPAVALAGVRPGVRPLLDAFRQRGLRQVVISDYEPGYKLEALGLDREFDAIFAGETLGYVKPAAELFRRAIAALGIQPEELLHIGDRPEMDAACAAEVGYRAVIVGRDFESPAELLAWFDGRSA